MKKSFTPRYGFVAILISFLIISCAFVELINPTPVPTNPPVKITPTSTPIPSKTPTKEPTATQTEPEPVQIHVDDFGANPYDDQPDSDAIQLALKNLQSGETLLFTSGTEDEGYSGYMIDKTIFIVKDIAMNNITLKSTNPENPAFLFASRDLKGFVIQLYSRANFHSPAALDNITLQDLNIDAGRESRTCAGADQIPNGVDDNWGSWMVGECPHMDDPWCNAGGISLPGLVDFSDYQQRYKQFPDKWTTGLKVDNLTITNVECGTALGLSGAASSITNTMIDTAGEHTHTYGCTPTDPDGEMAFWSDGITFDGTEIVVENNSIINASDVGIVFFGGKDTKINHNLIISENGNYGAFAGIAVHTWGFGDISGLEVIGNTVINTSDTQCGGIHAGINIGTQMWGIGCREAGLGTIGTPNECVRNPATPEGGHCITNQQCQIWAHVAEGGTLKLMDNTVTGCHINFLIGGLENLGELIIDGNISLDPQPSDWEAAKHGCHGVTWGPLDFVALFPILPGWTEQEVFCER